MHRKYVKTLFANYLKGLTSAKPYYANNRSLHWFKGLLRPRKNAIYKRLKDVDYEGYKILRGKLMGLGHTEACARRNKFLPSKSAVLKDAVLVEQEKLITPNSSVLRFVPAGGIRKAVSLVRAAGYTSDETAAIFNMKPEDVNALATPEDIKAARREVPEAVRLAADGYVLRDLLAGHVGQNTEIADRISARRTKLILDASAEGRALRGEDKELEAKREMDLSNRFGVDRKKGKVIDVETKEKKA